VPEVDLGGALDSVRAVPEVDRVQVGGQDPVLRPDLVELPRERRLLQLARERALARQVGVLDELLRDRRAALHDLLVAHVLPDGTHDAVHVDAAVLEEPLVLDRDDRLLHHRRDLVRGDDLAALGADQPREHAVAGRVIDDPVLLLTLRLPDRVELRDVAADPDDEPVRERDEAEQAHQDEDGEKANLADPATALAVRALRLLPAQQNPPILAAGGGD
jgi:hypothetical protein